MVAQWFGILRFDSYHLYKSNAFDNMVVRVKRNTSNVVSHFFYVYYSSSDFFNLTIPEVIFLWSLSRENSKSCQINLLQTFWIKNLNIPYLETFIFKILWFIHFFFFLKNKNYLKYVNTRNCILGSIHTWIESLESKSRWVRL